MSLSNQSCEKEFDEEKSISNDYYNEKLEGNNKIQTRSEIACGRNDASDPCNQVTVATMMNQTQIQNIRSDEKKGDFANKSEDGESSPTTRKPLRNVLTERRFTSRTRCKFLKNQTRRQIPHRRKVGQIVRARLKIRKSKGERKKSEDNEYVEWSEEKPKRGKRGLVGGKAKAKPPKEDSEGTHDSDGDDDSFHCHRISLGYFQQYRDVQGASTSTRQEIVDKTSPYLSLKTQRFEAKTSEERELLELRRWGMASLITDDIAIVETDKLEVNKNSLDDFERNEANLKESCDSAVNNSLYRDLDYNNEPLMDMRKMESDTKLRSSLVKPKSYPKPESLLTDNVSYQWIQTPESISVEIKCPVCVVRSNQVSVKTTPVSLEIKIKSSNESDWTPFFNCDLAGRIYPEGSTWCLGSAPSILIHLKKYKNDFWESFTKSETLDNMADESQTDSDEFYQPAVLDIIKNLSLIDIDKACTKDLIKSNKNKSEVCRYAEELRDVMESSEELEKIEKFE